MRRGVYVHSAREGTDPQSAQVLEGGRGSSLNAAALPVATDDVKIDPTTDPSIKTCVNRVESHRQGTHLPTDADKAKYADICSKCFEIAYQSCQMTAPSDHDVLADHSTGCFPDSVKHCVGLKAGGPQAANPDTPVNVPVTVDQPAKRDIDQGGEPSINVPASLTNPTKRDIDQGGEPNMNVPASLANPTRN